MTRPCIVEKNHFGGETDLQNTRKRMVLSFCHPNPLQSREHDSFRYQKPIPDYTAYRNLQGLPHYYKLLSHGKLARSYLSDF